MLHERPITRSVIFSHVPVSSLVDPSLQARQVITIIVGGIHRSLLSPFSYLCDVFELDTGLKVTNGRSVGHG